MAFQAEPRGSRGLPCGGLAAGGFPAGNPRASRAPDHKRNATHCRALQPMALDQEERSQLGPKMLGTQTEVMSLTSTGGQ